MNDPHNLRIHQDCLPGMCIVGRPEECVYAPLTPKQELARMKWRLEGLQAQRDSAAREVAALDEAVADAEREIADFRREHWGEEEK